jgi:hypothetical protein
MKLQYFLPSTHQERVISNITFVEPADIAIMWSAKAACTTAVTWAFLHDGLLDEAIAYSSWIHRYRLRRYQKSERYRSRLRQLGRYTRFVAKVVRNPYERAVSSFIHAHRYGYEDQPLSDMLGRPVDKHRRFSFREFVQYLEQIDLTICNTHHRRQSSPLERHVLFGLKPNRIIRIEDGLEQALGEVERQFGLPPSDFSNPIFRSWHHTSRRPSEGPAADRMDIQPQNTPPAAAFYDDDLTQRVARLYDEDFVRYGYDKTFPR